MNVPLEVRQKASDLIEMYGEHFTIIEANIMRDIYMFDFPVEECIGYPFLFLFNKKTRSVEIVTGIEALDIIGDTKRNEE